MSVFTTTKNIQNLVVPFRSGHKLGEGPEVTAGAEKIIFWHPLQYKLIKAVYKFLFYKYFSIPEPIAVNDIVLKFRF